MASMTIRELDPDRDALAVVALIRQTHPNAVIDERSWLHRVTTLPEAARHRGFVAVADGRFVGNGYAFRSFFARESRNAHLFVVVDEPHRRHGVGGALLDAVTTHARTLDVDSFVVEFHENEEGVAFASRHGFREIRAETESVLAPRSVADPVPQDLEIRPLTDVDPHLAYEVDMEATHDMPADEPFEEMTYEEWTEHVLDLFTRDGSFVVMADGVAAALSLLIADPESGRATNMFTGTLRRYRGRGLGRAAKLASIHWAAAHGITSMATHNDESNAPMLAINRRLGYRPAGRLVVYLKGV